MKIQILGCGSSTGVPIVGCHCPVCSSHHPFNQRTRPAAVLHLDGGEKILFDCGPDLRQQALNFGLERVDAVLLTHLHADHIMGIDELRVFNYLTRNPVDLYGYPDHLRKLRQMFPYIFQKTIQQGGGKPEINTHGVQKPFELYGQTVTPVPLKHGRLRTTGYRVGNIAYLVDFSEISEESKALLGGLDILILGALRHEKHGTHLSIGQAITLANELGAKKTVLTHMGHQVDYFTTSGRMPKGVELAVDGMVPQV